MYFVFPETKGLSLEEINVVFGDTVAVRLQDASNDSPLQETEYVGVAGKSSSVELIENAWTGHNGR